MLPGRAVVDPECKQARQRYRPGRSATLDGAMTLTQLNAFVLVARLGSVTAAASALGVSEPAVSQALTALRQHLGDQLITRGPAGMTLTPGGSRLLATASQIVVLGAEAHAAVRAAQGAPEQLRIVATSTFAEFVAGPLVEAFTRRFPGSVEVSTGVAASGEQAVLVANRLADMAFGDGSVGEQTMPVVSEPIFKYRVVVVTAGQSRPRGPARSWRWLVDPAGADPASCSPTWACLRAISGCSRVRRPRGLRRRMARGSRRRSSTWCRSSYGGENCHWWTCPACRSRRSGMRRCSSGSTAARQLARCGASSGHPKRCS
jgi:DNA-binding transcriptional LysR family regulator